MIELPKQKAPPLETNPKILVIYSKPKVGKTPCVCNIPGLLEVDLEDSSDYIDALRVSVIGLRPPIGETEEQRQVRYKNLYKGKPKPLYYLTEVITALRQGHSYTGIALDTLTKLEEWCELDATIEYMNSPSGISFNRWTAEDQNLTGGKVVKGEIKPQHLWESVLTLPYGAGTRWLQNNFRRWINHFAALTPRLILLAHVKVSQIKKEGIETETQDLDLYGKVRGMTTGLIADAFGYMYRSQNKNYISFTAGNSAEAGSRAGHLEGKNILISEMTEDKILKTYWENIYI